MVREIQTKETGWSCGVCTLINKTSALQCSACNSLRDSSPDRNKQRNDFETDFDSPLSEKLRPSSFLGYRRRVIEDSDEEENENEENEDESGNDDEEEGDSGDNKDESGHDEEEDELDTDSFHEPDTQNEDIIENHVSEEKIAKKPSDDLFDPSEPEDEGLEKMLVELQETARESQNTNIQSPETLSTATQAKPSLEDELFNSPQKPETGGVKQGTKSYSRSLEDDLFGDSPVAPAVIVEDQEDDYDSDDSRTSERFYPTTQKFNNKPNENSTTSGRQPLTLANQDYSRTTVMAGSISVTNNVKDLPKPKIRPDYDDIPRRTGTPYNGRTKPKIGPDTPWNDIPKPKMRTEIPYHYAESSTGWATPAKITGKKETSVPFTPPQMQTPGERHSKQYKPPNPMRDNIREVAVQPPAINGVNTGSFKPQSYYFEPMHPKDPRWNEKSQIPLTYNTYNTDQTNKPPHQPSKIKKAGSSLEFEVSDTAESKIEKLLKSIPEGEDQMKTEETPGDLKITLMPHQKIGLAWLIEHENGEHHGAILADDMGLGKTIQTIALILKNRQQNPEKTKTTLVVAPLALGQQWAEEIKTKTCSGALSVLVYHGPSRPKEVRILKKYDIVITTYQTVASEMANGGLLFQMKFYRIVLDEAQNIKNKSAKCSIACCELQAKRRICLSGTPIQNNVDELYSLLKFLKLNPYDDHVFFSNNIAKPLKKGYSKQAMERLQLLLQACMLRRTKNSMTKDANGEMKPLIALPKKNIYEVKMDLSPWEMSVYTKLEERMKNKLRDSMEQEKANMTNILGLILRLRQACNHVALVGTPMVNESLPKSENNNESEDELDSLMQSMSIGEATKRCVICSEPILSGKKCADCNAISGPKQGEVGISGTNLSINVGEFGSKEDVLHSLQQNWFTSTKIEKVLSLLDEIDQKAIDEPTPPKTIIFSQFTTMLDVLEVPLKEKGVRFERYDGAMKPKEREIALESFKNNEKIEVLLISLKCGSVGLNLTAASNVIMFELYWNPAVEDQAIDRIHRIGQKKEVNIYRFIVNNTIEERIVTIQTKKRELINGALGETAMKRGRKGMSLDELKYLLLGDGRRSRK